VSLKKICLFKTQAQESKEKKEPTFYRFLSSIRRQLKRREQKTMLAVLVTGLKSVSATTEENRMCNKKRLFPRVIENHMHKNFSIFSPKMGDILVFQI